MNEKNQTEGKYLTEKKPIYFFLFEMQIARKFVETCATLFFETLRFDEKKLVFLLKLK